MPPNADIAMAEAAFTRGGVIRTSSIGSCVAVALHDAATGAGAMAHVMLPFARGEDPADPAYPARHAPEAIAWLIDALARAGSLPDRLVARIAGGANMFPDIMGDDPIGNRNVRAVRQALADAGIRIVQDDTGGHAGRTVEFDAATGAFLVSTKK